jgi:diketogulonate reductase-like aldo/keto reductase
MLPIPTRRLNDGIEIPQLGLGTWPMDDEDAEVSLSAALDMGYRLIDTAAAYGNEVGVGRGIDRSGVERTDVFVTTKLRGGEQGYDETFKALDASLKRLNLDCVDLYLIHWPLPRVNKYVESWRAMIKLREEGLSRSIGVSNFTEEQLLRLNEETGVLPSVNQIELHPSFSQARLRDVDVHLDIATESWSPLGRGEPLLKEPAIADAAVRHGVTPTQVVLRWHLQLGAIPIPKSSSPEHQRANLDVFSFALSDEEMAAVDAIGQRRMGGDPTSHEEF